MLITWLDFERNFVGNSFLGNFFSKFRMCFFKVKHKGQTSGIVGLIDVKGKGKDLPVIHYSDVIMSTTVSQITSLTIVYLTIYSGAD